MPDRWWLEFNDPVLNAHMEQALGDNFTLESAFHKLRASRALARREASDLFPDINALLLSDNNFQPGPDRQSITWGLDAAYQVDLWGEIQSRSEAAQFRAVASHEDYHAVALTLAAEIATTWFSLLEARAQKELLTEQVETNRKGVKAQELRFGRGFARSPDVLRQRQLVESTREQAVIVRARVEVLEHQLAVLMGEQPQLARYETDANLPELPTLPSTGFPSELLKRRPDVRRDYFALLAAKKDHASAVSTQYPRLNLTGSILNAAERPEALFQDWFVSIAGQLIAPLIDGGQRRAEVDRTSAIAHQRFSEYGQTMLVALQEVEDSLTRERHQRERIELLDVQLKLSKQASLQLTQQYFIGDVAYLDVLSTIQTQQQLQRERLAANLESLLFRIALYNALAGSFDTCPLSPAPSSSHPVNLLEELSVPSEVHSVPSSVDSAQEGILNE